MSNVLKGLKPEAVWSIFEEITRIPRCGGMEKNLQTWIEKWSKSHGIEYKKDEVGNICLTVEATPGQEKVVPLTLQAHQDMVCEKVSESSHDFSKDPLPITVDGEKVTSDGTSLGADDGIGLAIAMSILADPGPKHGRIEAVFTVDEEGGFTGVSNMKPGFFTGEYMINVDSEEEGVIIVSSAGGANTDYTFNFDRQPPNNEALRLEISGLLGGHSGVDIDLPRLNAIIVLAKGLKQLAETVPIQLIEINGGTRGNAIPRESYAVFGLPKDRVKEANKIIDEWGNSLDRADEPGLKIKTRKAEPSAMVPHPTTEAIIGLIADFPQGVYSWSKEYKNLVQTSNNLGTVKTDDGKITAHVYSRSSNDEDFEKNLKILRDLGKRYGADTDQRKGNAGWRANPDSPLIQLLKRCYEDVLGSAPEVTGIHGGLECGVFSKLKPELQIASIGPTIKYPHSPREYVEIPTVGTLWSVINKVVSELNSSPSSPSEK